MASQHGGQLGNNIHSRTEEVLQSDQRKAWKKGKAGIYRMAYVTGWKEGV